MELQSDKPEGDTRFRAAGWRGEGFQQHTAWPGRSLAGERHASGKLFAGATTGNNLQ
jgi:hypothetical protein